MRLTRSALGVVALLLVACENGAPPTAPDIGAIPPPLFNATAPECEVISFDDQGFSYGSIVTTLTTGFGFDLTVAVTEPNGVNNARIFDTRTQEFPDHDLQIPPAGECPDCVGLNNVLVIEGVPSWEIEGDSPDGGVISLTGFTGNGLFYFESYKALDQEIVEAPIRLLVDGVEIGASSAQGNGSVEIVETPFTTFEDVAEFDFGGSGAVDDLLICRTSEGVGRFTGGGGWLGMTGTNGEAVKVTHGFTLHCDTELSNNLEINWPDNKWHIEKEFFLPGCPICTDEPGVNPEPPPAPFDTFEAKTIGKLNNVYGAPIHFILQDSGEPGGKSDKGMIAIWDIGADPAAEDPILYVPFDVLDHGNLQAHYDQPHGCNVNKC